MKSVCLLFVLVTVVHCKIRARDILDIFDGFHGNAAYGALSAADKITLVEIIGAAESGYLARYIDKYGILEIGEHSQW